MKKNNKKFKKRYIFLALVIIFIIIISIFTHFGGFNTGKNINPEELKKYAKNVENIKIPDNAKIIALGEATHGNKEFQELKLDIFKILVEDYGVKAFAIEGDYGGCEKVNDYIQGGEGKLEEVTKFIGFQIYNTGQITELISYMKEYNETVNENQKIRFYGFDMQRYIYNLEYLKKECKKFNIDVSELEKLTNNNTWNEEYSYEERNNIINYVKSILNTKNNAERAIHFADILLQYIEMNTTTDEDISFLRDKFMAENVKWILEQEEKLKNEKIFISGHNTHIGKYASMENMGNLLFNKMNNNYYAIGTDFYKAKVNLPSGDKRIIKTFYSHNPLAKTAKMAGIDICWLDFSNIPEDTELYNLITNYNYMGSVPEAYSFIMRLLPPSYRIFQEPATLYDSMILVTNATPTKIDVNK